MFLPSNVYPDPVVLCQACPDTMRAAGTSMPGGFASTNAQNPGSLCVDLPRVKRRFPNPVRFSLLTAYFDPSLGPALERVSGRAAVICQHAMHGTAWRRPCGRGDPDVAGPIQS